MWYYIKQAIVPFLYLLFGTVIAIGILVLKDNLIWLKVVLMVLNVGLYLFIVGAASFKDGETALKVRMANDLERWNIIRTGEDRPLKLKEEFKLWKGFMPGLITCVPLVVLILVHLLINIGGGNHMQAAGIANLLYMTFSGFAHVNSAANVASWAVYLNLIALIIIPGTTGLTYYLGGRKIELQQQMIEEKKRQIYGDNYDKR